MGKKNSPTPFTTISTTHTMREVHKDDFIPATRNEKKNQAHKREKREFQLAASRFRTGILDSSIAEDEDYFVSGFWNE